MGSPTVLGDYDTSRSFKKNGKLLFSPRQPRTRVYKEKGKGEGKKGERAGVQISEDNKKKEAKESFNGK